MPPAVALLNYWPVREAVQILRIFFLTGFFLGVSPYITHFAGSNKEAKMGRARGMKRPVLRVNEPKKRVRESHERTRAAKNH